MKPDSIVKAFMMSVIILMYCVLAIAIASDGKSVTSVPIPKEALDDIRGKINAAQQALDGNTYLESLIVDKDSPCTKQLLKLAEADRAAKVNAYQAAFYALRDKLLKDGQKDWQPDYQLGVFRAPEPKTPPAPPVVKP